MQIALHSFAPPPFLNGWFGLRAFYKLRKFTERLDLTTSVHTEIHENEIK